MSRIDTSRLEDLRDVLEQVRNWDGIEDRGGGTLYLRRRPYLHFHVGRDSRRADVRGQDGWTEFDLPEPLPADVKQQFIRLLRGEYEGR